MLRLSYSLLNTWKRGDKQGTLNQYLGIQMIPTKQMELGTKFDKYIDDFVTKNKQLPPEFGGDKLDQPICQQTIVVKGYDNEFDLKGKLDIGMPKELIEVKCSASMDSAEYSDTGQLDFYFLLGELSGQHFEKGWLYRFDPTHRTYDTSLIWNGKRRIEKAKEMINKYGQEIKNYFIQQGVL